MYSRDFGGIKSDGQLYNYERGYNVPESYGDYNREPAETNTKPPEKSKGLSLSFLRNLRLDDLILIGIGLLLLLDSEEENDIFVILIACLLLF